MPFVFSQKVKISIPDAGPESRLVRSNHVVRLLRGKKSQCPGQRLIGFRR